jgi:hypothetical protein
MMASVAGAAASLVKAAIDATAIVSSAPDDAATRQ